MKAATSILLIGLGISLSGVARAEFDCQPARPCKPCQISGADEPEITEADLLAQPQNCQPGHRARYAGAAACVDNTGTCEPDYARAIELLTPLECVVRVGGAQDCALTSDLRETITDGRRLLAQLRAEAAKQAATKPPAVEPPLAVPPVPAPPLVTPPGPPQPPPEPPWGVWLAGAMVFDENGKDSVGARGALGGELQLVGPLQAHADVLFGKQFTGARLGLGLFWGSPDIKVGPVLDAAVLPVRYDDTNGGALFGGHFGVLAGWYVSNDVRLLGGIGLEGYADAAPYDGLFAVASLGTEWRPR